MRKLKKAPIQVKSDLLQVTNIAEHADGSATMSYYLTEEGKTAFRRMAKTQKKRYSQQFVNGAILKAIRAAMALEKGNP